MIKVPQTEREGRALQLGEVERKGEAVERRRGRERWRNKLKMGEINLKKERQGVGGREQR